MTSATVVATALDHRLFSRCGHGCRFSALTVAASTGMETNSAVTQSARRRCLRFRRSTILGTSFLITGACHENQSTLVRPHYQLAGENWRSCGVVDPTLGVLLRHKDYLLDSARHRQSVACRISLRAGQSAVHFAIRATGRNASRLA